MKRFLNFEKNYNFLWKKINNHSTKLKALWSKMAAPLRGAAKNFKAMNGARSGAIFFLDV